MKTAGIYIDFPFCIARCAFCAFHIEGFRSQWASKYIHALLKEIEYYAAQPEFSGYTIKTLYLGGGTPSLYDTETLCEIVTRCHDLFQIAPNAEITLETHPATINSQTLSELYQGGINRLSMGIQSFSDDFLKMLGRHHTAEQARKAYDNARAAGFKNIALDLIFGLPGQSHKNWQYTLDTAIRLAPEHLSIYGLSIEEGTLFARQVKEKTLHLPSERTTVIFYETAQSVLKNNGYLQYEISNFAKQGSFCRHNLMYWNQHETLGFGLAAHTDFQGVRRVNTEKIPEYIETLSKGYLPVCESENIKAEKRRIDKIIFGLRKTDGIPAAWVQANPTLTDTTRQLIDCGWLQRENNFIRLTNSGMLMADEVCAAYV